MVHNWMRSLFLFTTLACSKGAFSWSHSYTHPLNQCDLLLTSSPAKIPLNRFFEIKLTIKKQQKPKCSKLELKSFAMTMPSHNHGMLVKNKISKSLADSTFWTLRNLKLHMPGEWELRIQWAFQGETYESVHNIELIQ